MAVSAARLRQDFPEFKDTPADLIEKKIAIATRRTAPNIWGTRTDEAIMYLTAHLLSISPQGEKARLAQDNEKTVYSVELKQMKREITFGAGRVI